MGTESGFLAWPVAMSEEWNQDTKNSNWTDANTVRRLTETEVNSSTYQEQVRDRGVPQSYPDERLELRWIRPRQTSLIPLQCRRREKRKRRGFTSIQMLHTHALGRDRVNPERQEEEKSGHKRRAKAGTAQGGRGTNGPPEPTYTRNGPDKHRAHTWTPQHIIEGHRGRIRDRMGD